MRLDNRTDWDGEQLKELVRRVAEVERLTAADTAGMTVRVDYRRRNNRPGGWRNDYFRGWSRKGSGVLRLDCVKGEAVDKAEAAKAVATAFMEEQGGTWSSRSKDYGWGEGWRERWAWADALPMERRPELPKERPAPDVKVAEEMQRCLVRIVEWERKQKLAGTKLRVWKARLRRYARKLDKAIPAEEGKA